MADQWAQATIVAVAPNTATLAISAALQVAGNTTYTYTVSQGSVTAPIAGGTLYVIISGMQNAGNDGFFTVKTFGTGTFTVANASGVTEAGSTGVGNCPSDSGVGVMVRGSNSAIDGYFFHTGTNSYSGAGRTGFRELWKVVAGAGTFLQGGTGPNALAPQIGDVIAISAEGTTITGWYNGVICPEIAGAGSYSVADSSLSTGEQGITSWSVSGEDEYNWTLWNTSPFLPSNTPGNNGTQANDFVAGVITQSVLASDSFTYANGDLHTANSDWLYEGSSSFNVESDVVYSTAAQNPAFAYRSDASPANDQYAQTTMVITGSQNTQNCGPAVRISTSTETAYIVSCGNSLLRLGKYVAGTFTSLATTVNYAVTGDVIRLVARGTSIVVYHNGIAVLSAQDSSISSGVVGITGAGSGTVNGMSAWSGGNYTWTQTESDTFSRANGPLGTSWQGPYPNNTETAGSPLFDASIEIVSDAYSGIVSNGGDAYALYQATYSISGNVGVAGVTVNYTGTSSGSVTSTSGGAFSISGLANGSYTITPVLAGATFAPLSQNVTMSGANVTGINFTKIARGTRSK